MNLSLITPGKLYITKVQHVYPVLTGNRLEDIFVFTERSGPAQSVVMIIKDYDKAWTICLWQDKLVYVPNDALNLIPDNDA